VDTEILIIIYGSVKKDDFRVVNRVRCLAFLQSSIVFFNCQGQLANGAPRNDKRMVGWHNYYQVEWHSGKPKISPQFLHRHLTSENFLINDLSFRNPMSPPEDMEKQKRFKVGRACYTCRQKKIKVMFTRIP
jgi:hypothetical protein